MGDAKDQKELANLPFDTISSLKYHPTDSNLLLASSWDTTVRYYDVAANDQKTKFDHRAAILDCCFDADGRMAYSACLDTYVRELDLSKESIRALGQHEDSVSRSLWSTERNALVTGSWDRTIRFWDPRAATPQVASTTTAERVYHMDIVNHTLVVAMASRMFAIYDVRKMDTPQQQRESSLKYLTRSMACMRDGSGYATGSVEGRISVEYFDPDPKVQEQKYAFKCHRQTIDDVDHVWPVNAIAFHPIYNTFATAGSDGTISIWDHKSKKRLRQYPRYTAPVSALAFSPDGHSLAVGVGYTWDKGEEGAKTADRPVLFVKKLGDELKPKGWEGH